MDTLIDMLLGVPFLVKLVVSLLCILAINGLVGRLWLAILAGIAVLALWTPRGAGEVGIAALERLQGTDNLVFILILFLVVWFSAQMSAVGTMDRIVTAAESLLSRRRALAAVPMLIGFLPMPGGALFSAPLVDALDRGNAIDSDLKARINYWFRHIWEYWWPLYPGALLAAEIFRLPPHIFMLVQMPLSLVAVAGGAWFLLRRVPEAPPLAGADAALRAEAIRAAIQGVLPIVLLTAIYAAVALLFPRLARMSKYLPMVCGVAGAMAYLQLRSPLGRERWAKILFSRQSIEIALAIWLVRVYGALVEIPLADGRAPIELMRGELAAWGLPVLALVLVFPFVAGLTSGVAVGFVGASFPFIAALVPPGTSLPGRAAIEVLAYGFGYMGLILSPIHACLIVSCEHFKTGVGRSLAGLTAPTLVVLAGTLAWYWALRSWS